MNKTVELREMIKEMVDHELETSEEHIIYSLAEDFLYNWYEKQTEDHIKKLYENRVELEVDPVYPEGGQD